MLEVLFILVTIFIVYVVVTVATGKQEKKSDLKTKVEVVISDDKKEGEVVTEEPIKNAVKKEKPKPKSTKATKPVAMPTGTLRNPETGEIDKIATSYRMLKRWMKEALVKEGLLEKIYKTNELNAATKKKTNKAVEKLKKTEGYQ